MHVCDDCICLNLAGDSGNPLVNKWLASENCRLLNVELEPILEKAIDQPDAIAPKYATNPLTQVLTYKLNTAQRYKCAYLYYIM